MLQKQMIYTSAFLSMLLILGCSGDNYYTSKLTTDGIYETVMRFMERPLKALKAGDIKTYLSFFEKGAVWITPEGSVTKKTGQQFFHKLLNVYDFSNYEFQIDEMIIGIDLAVVRVSHRGLRPKDVVNVEIFTRHMYILRRQDNGLWKIARDISIGSVGEQFAPLLIE